MQHVDERWPVFVLMGLLVGEKHYQQTLVPRVKELKDRNGLDREVVLHSREIRRCEGPFSFLQDQARRQAFYQDLSALVDSLRIRFFAVVIDKGRLRDRFLVRVNPYDVSLSQMLSLVCGSPGTPSAWRPRVARIVAESRQAKEDKQLQAEFQNYRRLGLHKLQLGWSPSPVCLNSKTAVPRSGRVREKDCGCGRTGTSRSGGVPSGGGSCKAAVGQSRLSSRIPEATWVRSLPIKKPGGSPRQADRYTPVH